MASARSTAPDEDNEDQGMIEFIEVSRDDAAEEADTRWLIEHYAEVVEEYPMSWVAVQDQQVIGHGPTPHTAMQNALAKAGEPEGHPEDGHYETKQDKKATTNPHLYFIERSADWFLEH